MERLNPLLQQLREAVAADDWILAADVCLEISLAASNDLERRRADMLANAVRLQDGATVEALVEQSKG